MTKSRNILSNYIRCPWCGRQPVKIKRGRIVNHVTHGGIKCVGIGQSIKKAQ